MRNLNLALATPDILMCYLYQNIIPERPNNGSMEVNALGLTYKCDCSLIFFHYQQFIAT